MSSYPYIGSRISLISNSDMRYEGTLFNIDPANATVALSNVKCFGTEDRRPDVTAASDSIFQFILFKGPDIKNLVVCENQDVGVAAPGPNDPAIVTASGPQYHAMPSPSNNNAAVVNRMQILTLDANVPVPRGQSESELPVGQVNVRQQQSRPRKQQQQQPEILQQQQQQQQPQRQQSAPKSPAESQKRGAQRQQLPSSAGQNQQQPTADSDASSATYSGPGSTTYLQNRRPGKGQSRNATPKSASTPLQDDEFDFQSSNARFDKESFVRSLMSPTAQLEIVDDIKADDCAATANDSAAIPSIESITAKYNKSSSFFDDISLDRNERQRPDAGGREKNTETFGAIAQGFAGGNNSHSRRGGGRGGRSRRRSGGQHQNGQRPPQQQAGQRPPQQQGGQRPPQQQGGQRPPQQQGGQRPSQQQGGQRPRQQGGQRPPQQQGGQRPPQQQGGQRRSGGQQQGNRQQDRFPDRNQNPNNDRAVQDRDQNQRGRHENQIDTDPRNGANQNAAHGAGQQQRDNRINQQPSKGKEDHVDTQRNAPDSASRYQQ